MPVDVYRQYVENNMTKTSVITYLNLEGDIDYSKTQSIFCVKDPIFDEYVTEIKKNSLRFKVISPFAMVVFHEATIIDAGKFMMYSVIIFGILLLCMIVGGYITFKKA